MYLDTKKKAAAALIEESSDLKPYERFVNVNFVLPHPTAIRHNIGKSVAFTIESQHSALPIGPCLSSCLYNPGPLAPVLEEEENQRDGPPAACVPTSI